ncbi:MAG: N-acetylneuraminate synthase family protein [Pseudomonadota bacterium]|nr:N-acetylneuraminate synthase family protein [Pseudomonadota bacterium]
MFNQKPLIIFELANNHMGSIEHALKTIDAFAGFVDLYPFRFAFKFQFRDLKTFIHPDFQQRLDIKYVKRFSETALKKDQFAKLIKRVKNAGMTAITTPFDEPSVDLALELEVEIIKIASCALTDWPLLEKIVTTDKPLIASTAGSSFADIDRVVSFFQHRKKQFAILHCVGEYPTVAENLQINQIGLLNQRYPDIPVGFSTHEEPDNYDSVMVAIGKGAIIFEKHISVVTDKFPRNAYSATPKDMEKWLDNAARAFAMLGTDNGRHPITDKEKAALRQFKRGVFARCDLPAGHKLKTEDIFFAFPNEKNQLVANDISKYTIHKLKTKIKANAPINYENIEGNDYQAKTYAIVLQARKLFKEAGVVYSGGAELEISHHYGIDNFHKTGATMITIINRDYCKKLIALLPGQIHPEQFHKKKEETFLLLHGDLNLYLNDIPKKMKPGETVIVEPGVKHRLTTETGCVIEEISSTHYRDDSFYSDPEIMANKERKTIVKYWLD